MYDFYFGTREDIEQNEAQFLLSVKRMLPKWVNSIPDAEFLAICDLLDMAGKENGLSKNRFCVVETGAGASSLAFAFYAAKYSGIAYSWEMNSEKCSLLRTAMTESFGKTLDIDINQHWNPVNYSSLSPHLGLSILEELAVSVKVFMHDSEHVLNTLAAELNSVIPFVNESAYVLIDDAHYNYVHTDEAYVNLLRKKLGLASIPAIENNACEPFYIESEKLLKDKFEVVDDLSQIYHQRFNKQKYCSLLSTGMVVNGQDQDIDIEKQISRFKAFNVKTKKESLGD